MVLKGNIDWFFSNLVGEEGSRVQGFQGSRDQVFVLQQFYQRFEHPSTSTVPSLRAFKIFYSNTWEKDLGFQFANSP